MYKVYCFLTKNPTKWGLFSRFWTAGNEKPLHSAPHHNRPSHTTVTIKWTFFTPLHNPNSPTIRTPPHLTPILQHLPHTYPSLTSLNLSHYVPISLPSLLYHSTPSTFSPLSYLFSLLLILIPYIY